MERKTGDRLKRFATKSFFRTMNCPAATVLAVSASRGELDESVLAAAAGLAGGLGGATCGIVTGGALGIAMASCPEKGSGGCGTDAEVARRVGRYIRWFEESNGTTECRESTGIEFSSMRKMIRYMVPGQKPLKCVAVLRSAIVYLESLLAEELSERPDSPHEGCTHCARDVLVRIREQTGVGDPKLECAAGVLDGGVGLYGGACGALAASALATSLTSGIDFRANSMIEGLGAMAAMVRAAGVSKPVKAGRSSYAAFEASKHFSDVKNMFIEKAGTVRCREITGRRFENYQDFQEYMQSPNGCTELMDLVVNETSAALMDT